MAPLTSLIKINPKTFKKNWTRVHTDTFNKVKVMIIKDITLNFPDLNKPYLIHTDASDFQLGAEILQDRKTITLFSRKLTLAKPCYPPSDKEALSIQGVLQAYRDILYGTDITIKADHQNLTQCDIKSPYLLH